MNPFNIFPTLAWDVLLRESANVDPSTVHTILLAFPELDREYQWKKKLLLFGAVLPILCEQTLGLFEAGDMLRIRAVCTDWKAAAHGYLDNQPGLQSFIPEVHDSGFAIRLELSEGWRMITHVFDVLADSQRNLRWMDTEGGRGLSPELYRSVSVRVVEPGLFWGRNEMLELYAHLLAGFRYIGEFIRSLSISVPGIDFAFNRESPPDNEMNQAWSQLFASLPNLRELILSGGFPFGAAAVNRCDPFPEHIESLQLVTRQMDVVSGEACHALLSRIGIHQLRTVLLTLKDVRFGGPSPTFPAREEFVNLTQLVLLQIPPDAAANVKLLLGGELTAPNLTFLSLQMIHGRPQISQWDDENCFSVERDVMEWLLRFKLLRSLALSSVNGLSSPISGGGGVVDPLPTADTFLLAFFSIKNNQHLSYEFLRHFTNLCYWRILLENEENEDEEYQESEEFWRNLLDEGEGYQDSEGDENTEEGEETGGSREDEEDEESEESGKVNGQETDEEKAIVGLEPGSGYRSQNGLGQQFRTGSMYEYGIWEVVPKLTRVIVEQEPRSDADNPTRIVFDRWTYERTKKNQ